MIKPRDLIGSKFYSIWLHIAVFIVLHAGSRLSLLAKNDVSISDFYLPTAMAVVLINWLPPRFVLPALYINAVITSPLWGNSSENWPLWFLFGIPETVGPLLSWLLFRLNGGKCWLPDTRNLITFLVFGIAVPVIVETFLLQSMLLVTHVETPDTFWLYVASNMMSEFTVSFVLTIPCLYFITPWLARHHWIRKDELMTTDFRELNKNELLEIASVFLLLFVLTFILDFKKYWYVYALFSMFFAIRFGFGMAILSNLYIITLIYVFPKFLSVFGQHPIDSIKDSVDVFLGANVLFIFAALTGRLFSDFRNVQYQLLINNEALAKTNNELADANVKLELANKELDRFAYSVSHDLSAPLKTIQGVVNIGRLSKDLVEQKMYLEKIGASAQKLQTFIYEVLDFARNHRQEVHYENISLQELFDEIIGALQNPGTERPCKFVFHLQTHRLCQDRTRLKVILNNLISNAMRFQQSHEEHQPLITIAVRKDVNAVLIDVGDNGEGILPEVEHRMFEMFYRGSIRSQGSGLGLYIARDVAAKLDGSISYVTEFGKGSVFTVTLPVHHCPD
ncbi:MAG: ATP-binding protein [Chryseolinea sp.]